MTKEYATMNTTTPHESVKIAGRSLVCWRSIFGGFFVALLAYVILSTLGAAIGGASAAEVIRTNGDGDALATGTILWMAVSALISLAIGSYFATRTSTFVTARVGTAQGAVIAALFFGTIIYGAGKTAGLAGSALATAVRATGQGALSLASNPQVQNVIDRNLMGANLKSDPTTVVQGLATRLMNGQSDSARAYLAYQTGMSQDELSARYTALEQDFKNTAQTIGVKTADAVAHAAWALFATLVVGLIASIVGGVLGARANLHKPLFEERENFRLISQPALG